MTFKSINSRIVVLLLLIIATGLMIIWWVAHKVDKDMRSDLLKQARISAKAINIERVSALTGSDRDIDSIHYHRLKIQLAQIRNAIRECRFLYLMGRHADGEVFFFVDSLPTDSKDYAPPGTIYEEISDSYLKTFDTKQENVVGPITDRWGTLITALIPIKNSHAGNLVAVLGMDIEAKDWNKEIFGRCLFPIFATLLLTVLILLLASREHSVKARKESEEKLRNIIEHSSNLFYSHTSENELTYLSPQCREFFQCEPEEAMVRWTEFLTDNPMNEIGLKQTEKTIKTGKRQPPYELELVGMKGRKISVEVRETPVLENGRAVAIVGSLTDITDRKRAEETQRDSEEKFKFLAENMADIVWTLDMDFNATYVSPSIEKVLGFTSEERKRQKLEEMTTPESLERISAMFVEELKREKIQDADSDRSATIEVEYYHKNGSVAWMENSVKAIRDQSGSITGIYGTSHDITDRKKAEKALLQERDKLQEAISEIRKLSGLFPICANCKRIRDDAGYWNQIESYIRDHSEAEFSHSICPDCAKKLYPEFDVHDD